MALMAEMDGAPLLRFGVVADPQYADAPTTMNRYYANSLGKLREAVEFFNSHDDLQFVVTLGDTIDHGWENFDAILSVYDELRARRVFVLGNHDFLVAPEKVTAVPARLGLRRSYYDFALGGYRFVVVDGAEVSAFSSPPGSAARQIGQDRLAAMSARGDVNAKPWNGGMSEEQMSWLSQTIARAEGQGERVLLLGHFPVHPFNEHAMWDSARFVEIVTASPAVTAYFNGHDHAGNYGVAGGKHFVNFKGMIETEGDTAYSLVEIYPDRIEIIGKGTEPSRTLAL
jgi:hypothetical protein